MIGKRNGEVLVTGASRGIGSAIAVALAKSGFDLILWARHESDLRIVGDKCASHGANVRIGVVDVGDQSSVNSAGSASLEGLSELRGLVLNAGIGIWGPVAELDAADWRSVMATNLDGAFFSLQLALPLLKSEAAQVVTLGSDSEAMGISGRASYCASKWGLKGLMETLRRETRSSGLRISHLTLSRVDSYFRGKAPGGRPSSLSIEHVGNVVSWIFSAPREVEVREMSVSAIESPFGAYPEFLEGRKNG